MPNLRFGNNQDLLQQRGLGSDAAVCLGWQQSMCMWYYPQLQVFQQECYSSTREVHRGQKARRKNPIFPCSEPIFRLHSKPWNMTAIAIYFEKDPFGNSAQDPWRKSILDSEWSVGKRTPGWLTLWVITQGKTGQTPRFTLRMERGADSVQLSRQK